MSNAPLSSRFPTTRREFIKLTSRGIGLLAFSRYAPAFLTQAVGAEVTRPETGRPILVLVQLAGGNDGLNTLVPFEDDHYYRLRPTLAIAREKALRLDATQGLHPSCQALHELFQAGKLGIVQNVGYPNPNRSHFRSTEIWETGSDSHAFLADGWIGRFLDNACAGQPEATHDPAAVHLTASTPQSFASKHEHATFGLTPGLGNAREN